MNCGPNSIAEDKTEYDRNLECIGYYVDLDALSVGLSRNNFLRMKREKKKKFIL